MQALRYLGHTPSSLSADCAAAAAGLRAASPPVAAFAALPAAGLPTAAAPLSAGLAPDGLGAATPGQGSAGAPGPAATAAAPQRAVEGTAQESGRPSKRHATAAGAVSREPLAGPRQQQQLSREAEGVVLEAASGRDQGSAGGADQAGLQLSAAPRHLHGALMACTGLAS